MELTYLSENILDLIGVEAKDLVGDRAFCGNRLLREDLELLNNKHKELEEFGVASAIHRILDVRGLPVWVANSARKTGSGDAAKIRGCLVPLGKDDKLQEIDHSVISRFVHKLGNHFQLLTLLISSLYKTLPNSREVTLLQETVEKSIELTHTFSDYNQSRKWLKEVDLPYVLNTASITTRSGFLEKGVILEEQIDQSVALLSTNGDSHLLELAFRRILQNALEATESGGKVRLHAEVKSLGTGDKIARISVVDSGCGIEASKIDAVKTPFFSSKKGHDGLGLSMAIRFVEMHGGVLHIKSAEGRGTEIEVLLPAVGSEKQPQT